jgi:hypothetical protein
MEGLEIIILYFRSGWHSQVDVSHPVALILVLLVFFLAILVYVGVFDWVFQGLLIED